MRQQQAPTFPLIAPKQPAVLPSAPVDGNAFASRKSLHKAAKGSRRLLAGQLQHPDVADARCLSSSAQGKPGRDALTDGRTPLLLSLGAAHCGPLDAGKRLHLAGADSVPERPHGLRGPGIVQRRRDAELCGFVAEAVVSLGVFTEVLVSADLLCGGFPCQDVSVAGQRARTRRRLAPASSSSSPESLSLFDPDGFSSRTYPVSSLAKAVGTSESCLERWPTSGTAWRGGFSTAVSSECRSDAGGCSSSEPSLTEILEPPQNVPAKYSLSGRAARHPATRGEAREDAAVASTDGAQGGSDDVSYYVEDHENGPLRANGSGGPPRTGKQPLLMVASTLKSQRGKADGGIGPEETLIAAPLSHGSNPHSNAAGRRREDDENLVAYGLNTNRGGNADVCLEADATPPITNSHGNPGGVLLGASVRRLTPTECERLQHLPDNWTQLGNTPDSRRYAALGDAVTASVSEWVGLRLMQHINARPSVGRSGVPPVKGAGS
jgi:site-specific DNA-cytosine methylase